MPFDGHLKRHLDPFYPAMLFTKTQRGETTEVLIETFIRKQLRLKALTVTGGRLVRHPLDDQLRESPHRTRKNGAVPGRVR